MSQSPEARASYAARREMRIRRDKTAAALMPGWTAQMMSAAAEGAEIDEVVKRAARAAVKAADILLAELDRTRPPEEP